MLLNAITLFSYIITLILLFHSFIKKKSSTKLITIYGWLGISIVFHFLLLGNQININHEINIGALKALSLTSCLMLTIATSQVTKHINTVIVLVIFAIMSVLLSLLIPSQNRLDGTNLALGFHIIISIAAYTLLMLTAIQALLVYLRDYSLKHSVNVLKHRLPPLMRMEHWLFQLLTIGFIFLTISLISSLFFIDLWLTKPFIHKSILAIIAWFLFGLLLFYHYKYNLRGAKAARLILFAFVVLLLAITGTRLIQELIFNRT